MPLDADRIRKTIRKIRKLVKKTPAEPRPEQVHDLRTNSRRVEAALQARSLGDVKDAIGEWHDWDELLAIAKELLSHANCKLLRELNARTERRYERALHSAEAMRKRFLRFSTDKRHSRSSSSTNPLWSATAALAA